MRDLRWILSTFCSALKFYILSLFYGYQAGIEISLCFSQDPESEKIGHEIFEARTQLRRTLKNEDFLFLTLWQQSSPKFIVGKGFGWIFRFRECSKIDPEKRLNIFCKSVMELLQNLERYRCILEQRLTLQRIRNRSNWLYYILWQNLRISNASLG